MAKDTIKISYPSIHSGSAKSCIQFLKGIPDLTALFTPGQDNTKKRLFVTDGTVASLECMQNFISCFDFNVCGNDALLVLGSGESYKTIETVLTIVKNAIEAGLSRNDTIIGIGGGVVCDITAFAASVYKRGVTVQLVPTTLLAMVDAAIGGKTGCDFDNTKNILGTFYPAEKLYYWPEFVQYLPESQYNSGLAEAFKTALLRNTELYNIFKNEWEKIKARDPEILDTIIKACVHAKAEVVQKDFMEKNELALMNLGHSFAHALETIVGLGKISHGEAVAWGIGREIELSYKKDYCKESFRNEIFTILQQYGWETEPVPSIVKGGGIGERFLTAMRKDKKNNSAKITLIISKNIEDTIMEEVEDSEILAVLK